MRVAMHRAEAATYEKNTSSGNRLAMRCMEAEERETKA